MNTARSSPGQLMRAWRRFAAANGMLVLSLCALFVVALAAAAMYAREPSPVAGGQGLAGPGVAGSRTRGLSVGVDANDPVARFAQTRVGHIVFSPSNDDNCRRVLFDNSTGASGEVGSVMCQQQVPQGEVLPGDRLETLRKTFQR